MLPYKTTLAIIDDHPIVIDGLINLLKRKDELEIIGSFTNGYDFISFLTKNTVDVVLLDLYLPDINGMDLCKEIKAISPKTLVLAFTNHEERSVILKMLENGARGYLLKSSSMEEIMGCINEALRGEITFSAGVKEIISRPSETDVFKEQIRLTLREKEILKLVASGMTTSNMAKLLFLSKFTIDGHRKNLLQKFKAKNAAELISMARQAGLI